MDHIFLLIIIIISYEFFILFNIKQILKNNISLYKKFFKVFNYKNVSDYNKEKIIKIYSKKLLLTSIKLIIFSIFIFLLILSIEILNEKFIDFILNFWVFIETILLLFVYLKIKQFFI